MVNAPQKKGYATIALVQKGDSLTQEKRWDLSSAFFARMGVGPGQEGFLTDRSGSTVYKFRDVPVYRKESLDSILLYTFSRMASSRVPQAIVVSGDLGQPEELKKKMDIFSMLVHKLDTPAQQEEYVWEPAKLPVLDYKAGEPEISVSYSGSRIQDAHMNTAQALVTDIFGIEFLVLLRHRLEKDLSQAGIPVAGITFKSLRSADYPGDERYTVSVKVAPGMEEQALQVIARTIGSMDSAGVSTVEFCDAKEVILPGLLSSVSAVNDNVDRCISNFLFGANLAPASERVRLFSRKNIPEETQTKLFNRYASALLAGDSNLTLSLSARDTLDPAQAFMAYNANYNNGFAVPAETDYTWHRADSAGMSFVPPRIRIMKEKPDPVSGGTMWTFTNGIRVLFKEMKGSGMFSYALVLNGGLTQIPDLAQGEGAHIGPMLSLYDVAGVPAPVFRDFLQVNGLSMNADVTLNNLIISGEAPSAKFALMLKTLLSLRLERVANKDEFQHYAAVQAIREETADDVIFNELHPGFRYTDRPGALTPHTQSKAEAYYSDRFARFNDGVLIISGDLGTGVVKKLLGKYLGGFGVQRGTTPRRSADFKPRTGAVTIMGDKGPRGIRVVMEAPLSITSDYFYTSFVAADAMRAALIRELAPYGFTADVSVSSMAQPQERFRMEINCLPASASGLPAEVEEPDVTRALTAVRRAVSKASKQAPEASDVSAWKAALMDNVKAALDTPQGFTATMQVRYALNKDVTTRYQESISAITPERVRFFIASVSSGGTVEYVVE